MALPPPLPNNDLTQLFLQDFEDFEDEIHEENAKLEADTNPDAMMALEQDLKNFAEQNFGSGAQDYTDN